MSGAGDIRDRLRQAIALNREPGFHTAGHFLQISFDRTDPEDSHVYVPAGAHLQDGDGAANLGAVAMLADMALAACIRGGMDPSTRLATVSMTLQLTGTPATGDLHARSHFEGFLGQGASRQGMSRVAVDSAAGRICHGHGAFMPLEPPPGMKLFPMPRAPRGARPLPPSEMTREERAAMRRAEAVLAAGDEDFLARFWGYAQARRTKTGASCSLPNGMHVANRVHHVQGGILVGLAASTAAAALPANWRLNGVTACFVSPGLGKSLRAASKVVHRGMVTAVVRTEVFGPGRRRVLEALTTHSKVSPAAA